MDRSNEQLIQKKEKKENKEKKEGKKKTNELTIRDQFNKKI
jgi:hypothetical protein